MTYSPAPFVAGGEYDKHRNEILDADGRCIAVVWTRRGNERTTSREQFKDDPQGIANWKLLTAAPELLEALRECITDDDAMSAKSHRADLLERRLRYISNVAKIAIERATNG